MNLGGAGSDVVVLGCHLLAALLVAAQESAAHRALAAAFVCRDRNGGRVFIFRFLFSFVLFCFNICFPLQGGSSQYIRDGCKEQDGTLVG